MNTRFGLSHHPTVLPRFVRLVVCSPCAFHNIFLLTCVVLVPSMSQDSWYVLCVVLVPSTTIETFKFACVVLVPSTLLNFNGGILHLLFSMGFVGLIFRCSFIFCLCFILMHHCFKFIFGYSEVLCISCYDKYIPIQMFYKPLNTFKRKLLTVKLIFHVF